MELIDISNGTLIYSTPKELAYQEVINDFSNAKEVFIITWSISEQLLRNLYELDSSINLVLLTNIPKGEEENYKVLLDKSKFSCDVTILKNLKNHCKMFFTENIAYIGSQNFYGKCSFECGLIIKDKNCVKQIKTNFMTNLFLDSKTEPFYSNERKLTGRVRAPGSMSKGLNHFKCCKEYEDIPKIRINSSDKQTVIKMEY